MGRHQGIYAREPVIAKTQIQSAMCTRDPKTKDEREGLVRRGKRNKWMRKENSYKRNKIRLKTGYFRIDKGECETP